MDTPLHLRLAYAGHYSDPYAERRRWRHTLGDSAHGGDKSRSPMPLSWFGALVEHVVQQENGNEREDSAAESETRTLDRGAPQAAAEPQHADILEAEKTTASTTLPALETTPLSQHNVEARTLHDHKAEDSESEERTEPRLSRIVPPATPPPSTVSAHAETSPNTRHATSAVSRRDSSVQASEAVHEDPKGPKENNSPVSPGLREVGEEGRAGAVETLARRLQTCVLKTAALDDANHQLVCTFELRPNTGDTNGTASASSAPVLVSSSPPEVAKNDSTLTEEARRELAMHLYTLRHQVVAMQAQLHAHAITHERALNATKAAAKRSGVSRSAEPLRVEIVKAYEEEPVPRRKGPWRPADFAAAASRSPAAGAASAADEEAYSSDSFTADTASPVSTVASSEVGSVHSLTSSTAHKKPKDAGRKKQQQPSQSSSVTSDSTLSSTEGLFRKRQAAALQARAQQKAAAGKRGDFLDSSSTTSSSSPLDTTETSLTDTTTTTTTTTDTDTDSS